MSRRSTEEPIEIHDLDPQEFYEQVHSFEFWFQAVEGYLSGLTWGHRPTTEEAALSEADRDRLVSVLCNYCVGETAALEGASGLIAIAPNRTTKVFLATQVADEGRHLEVLLRRLGDLGVQHPELEIEKRASRSLLQFKRRLLELVASKDWEAAIFAQNVILESFEFAVFLRHSKDADPVTAEVLEGIINDERRHIGFGENELGRCLSASPHSRSRIGQIRRELDHLVLQTVEETALQLQIPESERTEVGRLYKGSVGRLGLP